MHPYLKHLLQDIKIAKRSEDDNLSCPSPTSFEEEMEEIERYISGEGERPLSYFTGLKKEHFPPKEQLSENDMKMTLGAFDGMLRTWNASIDFPENMPYSDRYEFLRNRILEEGFTPVKSGYIHFDFCSGYAPGCAWGKYCNCLDIWNEEM